MVLAKSLLVRLFLSLVCVCLLKRLPNTSVREAAERLCSGRLVMCQEGGYDLASTPYMGLGVIEGLSGITLDLENPFQVFGDSLGYTKEVLPHQAAVIEVAGKQVKNINI